MYAEPQEIFGNLDELCYVSYTFSKDLLSILTRNLTSQSVWNTEILVEALEGFSRLSEDGGVYHTYCLNYIKSLEYLEKLRRNDDFCEFEKWCEMDSRCNRLQLNDLLVSPMQHCTKLPLLISNIRKYTIGEDDKVQLTKAIGKVEVSLQCEVYTNIMYSVCCDTINIVVMIESLSNTIECEVYAYIIHFLDICFLESLEEKMKLERDQHRILEIQQQLVWPSIADLDPKAYIPECLKPSLSVQPSTTLLACPKRQLVHEGQLTLTDKNVDFKIHQCQYVKVRTKGKRITQVCFDTCKSTKTSDVHLFLFDDILLITKLKKMYKKKVFTNENNVTKTCSQTEIFYVVHRQPIALDRLSIHNVGTAEAAAWNYLIE
ncbi:hypothetical protein KUTeg_020046 [Tegillarca granosa]|uniref:DH domain-containing protein n=1 Tax=Tegillarca granosa TaxID=220873 RepID=A0ABQ9E6T8_TEGGR|nr:hypothetical protein KUTeg_020046 [Tegillarca granosa]